MATRSRRNLSVSEASQRPGRHGLVGREAKIVPLAGHGEAVRDFLSDIQRTATRAYRLILVNRLAGRRSIARDRAPGPDALELLHDWQRPPLGDLRIRMRAGCV